MRFYKFSLALFTCFSVFSQAFAQMPMPSASPSPTPTPTPTTQEPYRPPDAFASPTTTTSTGYCGDGICQNPPEECDLGGGNGPLPATCSTSCTWNTGSSSPPGP